jgi:hypothetical protein
MPAHPFRSSIRSIQLEGWFWRLVFAVRIARGRAGPIRQDFATASVVTASRTKKREPFPTSLSAHN